MPRLREIRLRYSDTRARHTTPRTRNMRHRTKHTWNQGYFARGLFRNRRVDAYNP